MEGYTGKRFSSIAKRSTNCEGTIIESWSYAYDGDGVRVGTAHFVETSPDLTAFPGTDPTPDWVSLYYFGGQYEVTNGVVKRYYSFAGQTVAMKQNGDTAFTYFLSDHLGSTSVVLKPDGTIEQQRNFPFGASRPAQTISKTDLTYTGQRDLSGTGLMDYKARFYSPYRNQSGL